MPAGGRTVFLADTGDSPQLRAVGAIPEYVGEEYPAAFGQSADALGTVFVQWHRRDNAGRVETMRIVDNNVRMGSVPGTETAIDLPGLMSFASVSVRGTDVYRVRPEKGFGLCRHTAGNDKPEKLCAAGSICSPVLTRDHAIYGGLNGTLYIVPLSDGQTTSFRTAFGARSPLPWRWPTAESTFRAKMDTCTCLGQKETLRYRNKTCKCGRSAVR